VAETLGLSAISEHIDKMRHAVVASRGTNAEWSQIRDACVPLIVQISLDGGVPGFFLQSRSFLKIVANQQSSNQGYISNGFPMRSNQEPYI